MKTQRVIAGVVLLAFFGILDPVFSLVVIGIALGLIMLFDGLNFFDRVGKSGPMGQENLPMAKLSTLDRTVLEMVSQNKTADEIARSTGVSGSVVSEKVSNLTSTGYLSNNMLTERGFEVLRG